MLWRLWFEGSTLAIDSWTVIVIAKNVVGGLHDLLTILTCNNPTATIFGFAPLQTMSMMIKGSAMNSVWVGPAGFFRIAADMATATAKGSIQEKREALNLHISWLLIEKEAVAQTTPHDSDALAAFDTSIAAIKTQISDLDQVDELIHT